MSIISLKNVRTTTKKPAMWTGRIFRQDGRRNRRVGGGLGGADGERKS
jgi:hypothetical protein